MQERNGLSNFAVKGQKQRLFMASAYKSTDLMRDMVSENSSLIPVLGRFGIPLGFADKTVGEVCRAQDVDQDTFLAVVNFTSGKEYGTDGISLPTLMEYLRQAHTYFLEFNLPAIRRRLLEAVDCSGEDGIGLMILRFYDGYVSEVRRHMEYENDTVFVYVEQMLSGILDREYSISNFEGTHSPIGSKLKELKDVIIRYYPEKNNYLLNEVLLDIIRCEEDLSSHCRVEDKIFVPAVKLAEQQLASSGNASYSDGSGRQQDGNSRSETLSDREKEVLVCVAKGLSNKEIADSLFLSVHTVATHRRNISGKLQIHSTAGLIIYAIANKLVSLQDIREQLGTDYSERNSR